MYINYSDSDVKIDGRPSIFLAGPTRRDENKNLSWRREAEQILKEFHFDGIVYVPEFKENVPWDNKYLKRQTDWEWKALDAASVIAFWIPRELNEMPGFTTNIEFGRYITSKPESVVLGYPGWAKKMSYMEYLYNTVTGRKSHNELKTTLQEAVDMIKKGQKFYD